MLQVLLTWSVVRPEELRHPCVHDQRTAARTPVSVERLACGVPPGKTPSSSKEGRGIGRGLRVLLKGLNDLRTASLFGTGSPRGCSVDLALPRLAAGNGPHTSTTRCHGQGSLCRQRMQHSGSHPQQQSPLEDEGNSSALWNNTYSRNILHLVSGSEGKGSNIVAAWCVCVCVCVCTCTCTCAYANTHL